MHCPDSSTPCSRHLYLKPLSSRTWRCGESQYFFLLSLCMIILLHVSITDIIKSFFKSPHYGNNYVNISDSFPLHSFCPIPYFANRRVIFLHLFLYDPYFLILLQCSSFVTLLAFFSFFCNSFFNRVVPRFPKAVKSEYRIFHSTILLISCG